MTDLERILNRSIDDFEWSVRSRNCMMNAGIQTIRDLVRKTEHQLLNIPNFGRKSLGEIKYFLADRRLRLGMDLPGARLVRLVPTSPSIPCEARVRVTNVDTRTRRGRATKTQARGLPIDQCAEPSVWHLDGTNLCASHAGRRALEILERGE